MLFRSANNALLRLIHLVYQYTIKVPTSVFLYAQVVGGNITVPLSEAENKWLYDLTSQKGSFCSGGDADSYLWLGAHDAKKVSSLAKDPAFPSRNVCSIQRLNNVLVVILWSCLFVSGCVNDMPFAPDA